MLGKSVVCLWAMLLVAGASNLTAPIMAQQGGDINFDVGPFDEQAPGQMSKEDLEKMLPAILAAYAALFGCVLVFSLIMWGVISYLMSSAVKAVPEQFRQISPGMIWLLLIPCVPIVFNFFVFTRVPKSLSSYLQSRGNIQLGDCGEKMGLNTAIAFACCLIPVVGFIAAIAALVMMILTIVKVWEAKKAVESLGSQSV